MVTWQKMENLPEGLQNLTLEALLRGGKEIKSTDKDCYWYQWTGVLLLDGNTKEEYVLLCDPEGGKQFKVY